MKTLLHITTSLMYLLTAFVLIALLFLPAVVLTLVKSFVRFRFGEGVRNLSGYLRRLVYSIDQTGNVFAASLFNATLRKDGGYAFGNPDETISSALGKNQRRGTLTRVGRALVWLLDKFEREHAKKSIEALNNG